MKKVQKLLESLRILLKRIIDNPGCLFYYPVLVFYSLKGTDHLIPFYKKIKTLGWKETIDYLIANRKSFVRFGTGESQIAMNMGFYGTVSAQNAIPLLSKRMRDLFKQDKVVIGILPTYLTATKKQLKEKGNYEMHLRGKVFLRNKLKTNALYGDAVAFRCYFDVYDYIESFLSNKRVVIISRKNENIENYNVGKEKLFVEIPTTFAFEKYSEITKKVEQLIVDKKLDPQDTIFLLAAGPTAKPLTIDIDARGFMAWDVGSFFEDCAFKKIGYGHKTTL